MNEQIRKSEEIDIDLNRLFCVVRREKWTVAAVTVFCALVFVVAALLFAASRYQSSVLFYVGDETTVDHYIVILDTRETLLEVIGDTGSNRTITALRRMIEAENVEAAQFLRVTVTSPDPREAQTLAASISCVLPRRTAGIVEGTEVRVADAPVAAERPTSPSYCITALAGSLVGLALSVGTILGKELLESRK